MKLARLYTGKPGFISCVRGFHGKSYGSLSLMGKAEYRCAVRAAASGRLLRALRRRGAVEAELRKAEAVGHGRGGRRGGAGAGRGGRHRAARTTTGRGCARSAPATACCSSRTRCRPGMGRTGQDVRRGALGRGAGHPVPGQGPGRRRDAALRVHLDAGDLEGPRAEPVHPLLDLRRESAGLRRRHRGGQRHAGGGPARAGRGDRRLPAAASCAACSGASRTTWPRSGGSAC